MKRLFDPQIQKASYRLENGDVVGLTVSDEDAVKILDGTYWDKFSDPLPDYKVGDDFGGEPLDEDGLAMILHHRRAFQNNKKDVVSDNSNTLIQGLKAPHEWHQSTFLLEKDVPSSKEISATRLVENEDGDMDEIRTAVGNRGAVASGTRQDDGSIIWDWNYEDEKDSEKRFNLLDFYVLPDLATMPPKAQPSADANVFFHNEGNNGPEVMSEKPSIQNSWSYAEHRDYIARVAQRMKKDLSYERVRTYIDQQKIDRNCR